MFTRPSRRAWLAGLLLAPALLGAAGCGGPKRKPVFTTKGTVLLDGKPVANVTVFLHPPAGEPDPVRPLGMTDAEGVFKLTTYEAHDGAPAGDYVVTLMYEPLDSPLVRRKGKKPEIPAKYTTPETSPLRATVQPRPDNVLDPINLP
jgi:hypothetical protein